MRTPCSSGFCGHGTPRSPTESLGFSSGVRTRVLRDMIETSSSPALRRSILVLGGEVLDEKIGRLNDVVIDAYENEIVRSKHVISENEVSADVESTSLLFRLPFGRRNEPAHVLRPPFTPITWPVM
jgi:hypothetical protein